jgi:cytochrome c oxidase subunit 2
MKEMTGNPNFVYEISCDQMCGNSHFSMRGIIDVVDQEEYDVWMAKQKPQYLVANPDKEPASAKAADSTGMKPSVGSTDSAAKKIVAKL